MQTPLTIGLFLCDHVHPAYREEHGNYPQMFQALFPEFKFRLYDAINGHFPASLDECDAYMATGSRHSVYEDLSWIQRLKATIRQIQQEGRWFVGVCFGHQLMGEALGGRVAKSPNGWSVGVHTFDVFEKTSWMEPWQEQLNLIMMCQDQVLDLPPGATVLAGNTQCPVGIFQVGERMLGIQAHPEYSKAFDRLLMESRIDRMGEEVVSKGIESLRLDPDREVIRSWVRKFFEYG